MAYKKYQIKHYVKKQSIGLTQKVAKLATKVNKLKPEMKYSASVAPGGTTLWLNNAFVYLGGNLARGTTASDRIGAKVRLQHFKAIIYTNSTVAANPNNIVRFVVAIDKDPGLVTTWQSLFDNLSVTANYNMDNNKRFKVLKDVIFTNSAAGGTTRVTKFNINLKGSVCEYTVADLLEYGMLKVFMLSDNAAAVGGMPIDWSFKLEYTDE